MDKVKKVFVLLLIATVVSFGLTGCKDAEKEEAIAEAATAKTELTKIKATLAGIMSERNNLKSQLTTVMEARDKLQVIAGQAANIKEQLAGLTSERDSALAKAMEAQSMVTKLKGQLAEQVQKVTELGGQNNNLQAMIDELKKKLSGGTEIPSFPEL